MAMRSHTAVHIQTRILSFTQVSHSDPKPFIMKAQSLLALLLSSVQATKVLIPLYVYPSVWETPSPWQYIYDTIASHPNIEFQIILNVDNGPDGDTAGYNEDWISEVPKLNAYPNVHTFGYVPVLYGARSESLILQDVTDWANWNTYTAANISVNGIFYDSVPNHSGKRATKDLALMQSLISSAKATFATTPSFEVMFNPGTRVQDALSSYFEMADHVVIYEQYAANFTSDILSSNIPDGMASKSIILLHDFTKSGLPDSTVDTWLESFVEAGLGAANILSHGYEQINTSDPPASIVDVASILTASQPGP